MPIEPAFVERFSRTVGDAAERLLAMSDSRAGAPRAPGEWSRKQIIGQRLPLAGTQCDLDKAFADLRVARQKVEEALQALETSQLETGGQ